MKRSLLGSIALGGLIVALGAGCSSSASVTNQPAAPDATAPSAAAPNPAAATTVSIANFSFQPQAANVAVGATVTWTNNDSAPHTVSADDGSFDSGTLNPGQSYSHTFTSAGTVAYHCAIHSSMHGSVVVQ